MNISKEEIKEIVYEYIIDLFPEQDKIKFKLYSSSYNGENLLLLSELGIDSLDELTLIINLEKEFNIVFDDDVINYDCSILTLVNYIDNKING